MKKVLFTLMLLVSTMACFAQKPLELSEVIKADGLTAQHFTKFPKIGLLVPM